MPFTSSYDPGRRWLLTIATGHITLHDVRTHLHERVRRQLGGAELIDTTRAELGMRPADLPHAVAIIREASAMQSLGPTAIVVTNDYGDCRTFRRREDAERWLTVGPFEHAR